MCDSRHLCNFLFLFTLSLEYRLFSLFHFIYSYIFHSRFNGCAVMSMVASTVMLRLMFVCFLLLDTRSPVFVAAEVSSADRSLIFYYLFCLL